LTDFHKLPNEGETEYIYRICSNKDEIGSWIDVARLLNVELGYEYTESKYRKDYNAFQKIFDANKDKFFDDRHLQSLREQQESIRKERYMLQTEKLEYNRWLRENARDELIVEKIVNAIDNLNPIDIPARRIAGNPQNKDFVLMFGDEHYGAEFEIHGLYGEVINKYNVDVFEQRMWKLLDETIEIIQKENVQCLHVFSMGDFTDGILRVGQLMKLQYGVVDGTVKYMEFISQWLNEMTRFCRVKFHMTNGNHSELRMFNQPKSAFKDENMGKIVSAYIKARLSNNENFVFVENMSGYIFAHVANYNILGVHGEEKDMVKAIKDLSNVYNVKIDYLVGGHLHHGAYEDVGIERGIIRVPSIVGVDDFAMSINRINSPAATLAVFEEGHGKKIEYTIDLR
jgi:hypothetical protein